MVKESYREFLRETDGGVGTCKRITVRDVKVLFTKLETG